MNNLKFAQYLADKGLLNPIVSSYKDWREQQNYPFTLRDKRVFKVAILKALLTSPQNIPLKDIDRIADVMVANLYNEKKEPANKEIQELMIKYKILPEFENKVVEMKKVLDQEAFIVWLENSAKGFEERKMAELSDPKQAKEIQDKKIDKDIEEQMNKEIIVENIDNVISGVNMTVETLKEAVKKRIIRKKSLKNNKNICQS